MGGEAEGDEGDKADVEMRLGDGEGCQRQHLGPQPRDGAAPNPPPSTLTPHPPMHGNRRRAHARDGGCRPLPPSEGGGRRCRREGMG